MSQEAVERVLERLLTDERFRTRALTSLAATSVQEGYVLTKTEQQLLSGLNLQFINEVAAQLNPGLCRAQFAPK